MWGMQSSGRKVGVANSGTLDVTFSFSRQVSLPALDSSPWLEDILVWYINAHQGAFTSQSILPIWMIFKTKCINDQKEDGPQHYGISHQRCVCGEADQK